jgi:hypothetical protein
MKNIIRRSVALLVVAAATWVLAYSPGAAAKKDKNAGKSKGPDSVVVLIGNRMFPEFGEIVSARMHRRQPIGDTDYAFEVVKFYPQFSIIDSTKQIVSVSDEPKNPAFRIKVFRADSLADSTWAFYAMDIPHFSKKSPLWFRVLQFDYRGEIFKKEPPKEPQNDNGKKK